MNGLKPIETIYNGYRFRSRLEARWAIFFDALNIKYFYETEGLVLPNGEYYLPDFYLPASKTFFEVKGVMSEKDMSKISQLLSCNKNVAIGYPDMSFQACEQFPAYGQKDDGYSLSCKEESWLIYCYACNEYHFIGALGSWECRCCGYYDGDSGFSVECYGNWVNGDWWVKPTDKVKEAFEKAKQARFEHGEKPVV